MSQRWETSYYLRRLLTLEGSKGWRVASPKTLAGYTVHRLLFHNCGYFDGELPLDLRYSIPRWLSYLHPPLFRFYPLFLCYADRSRVVCQCRTSFSFSSLNRITELFFQALWTELEVVYSHVMERRLPEISGLLSLPLRICLVASDDLAGLTRRFDRIFIHPLVKNRHVRKLWDKENPV